jgi:hypothetical protein
MKKLFLILISGVMIFFVFPVAVSLNLFAQEKSYNEAPPEVKNAALKGFGGRKAEDMGAPFRIYTFEREKILNYDGKTSVLDIVSPTSRWNFPVAWKLLAQQKFGWTFLTVGLLNGEWQAVSSGGSTERWDFIMKNWPPSDGYEHIFVDLHPPLGEFVVLIRAGEIKILNYTPSHVYNGGEKIVYDDKLYEPSVILLKLRDLISKE